MVSRDQPSPANQIGRNRCSKRGKPCKLRVTAQLYTNLQGIPRPSCSVRPPRPCTGHLTIYKRSDESSDSHLSFPLVMSSYLRSWLPTLSLQQSSPAPATEEEEEEEEESPTTPTNPSLSVQNVDDDSPPAFPAIESAQRISLAPSTLMPPPPIPALRIPGPPVPSSSSLMPPPSTTKPPTQLSKSKKREKVVLAPGHSPLDWAALKSSGADLRVCALSLLIVNLHSLVMLSSHVEWSGVSGTHTPVGAALAQ